MHVSTLRIMHVPHDLENRLCTWDNFVFLYLFDRSWLQQNDTNAVYAR